MEPASLLNTVSQSPNVFTELSGSVLEAITARSDLFETTDQLNSPVTVDAPVVEEVVVEFFEPIFEAVEVFEVVEEAVEEAADSVESILAGIAESVGLQNLDGMDVYSVLFLLMSRMEEQQQGTVENLALLTERKGVLEQEAFKKSIGEPNQHDALLARPEFQNLDTNINLLTSQLQRTESLRQQVNTMISNLQRADHEAKMVTLRNIPTR